MVHSQPNSVESRSRLTLKKFGDFPSDTCDRNNRNVNNVVQVHCRVEWLKGFPHVSTYSMIHL